MNKKKKGVMRKQFSDYISDIDRLAENLQLHYGDSIVDLATFEEAYNSYLSEANANIKKKDFREKTFRVYRNKFSGVSREREVTKKTAKFLLEDETKKVRTEKKKFSEIGSVKKRVVRARKTVITRKKKKITVLRDKRGRFVKK